MQEGKLKENLWRKSSGDKNAISPAEDLPPVRKYGNEKSTANTGLESYKSSSCAENDITSQDAELNKKCISQDENLEKKSGHPRNAETALDPDELDEAQDAVFDEFLEQSTQIRIKSLTSKIAYLTEALNTMRTECKKLVSFCYSF